MRLFTRKNEDVQDLRQQVDRLSDVLELFSKFEQNRADAAKLQHQQIDTSLSTLNTFNPRLIEIETRLSNVVQDISFYKEEIDNAKVTLSDMVSKLAVLTTRVDMFDKTSSGEKERKFTTRGVIWTCVAAFLAGLLPVLFDLWKGKG